MLVFSNAIAHGRQRRLIIDAGNAERVHGSPASEIAWRLDGSP